MTAFVSWRQTALTAYLVRGRKHHYLASTISGLPRIDLHLRAIQSDFVLQLEVCKLTKVMDVVGLGPLGSTFHRMLDNSDSSLLLSPNKHVVSQLRFSGLRFLAQGGVLLVGRECS